MRILFEELLPRLKSVALDGEVKMTQATFVNGPEEGCRSGSRSSEPARSNRTRARTTLRVAPASGDVTASASSRNSAFATFSSVERGISSTKRISRGTLKSASAVAAGGHHGVMQVGRRGRRRRPAE